MNHSKTSDDRESIDNLASIHCQEIFLANRRMTSTNESMCHTMQCLIHGMQQISSHFLWKDAEELYYHECYKGAHSQATKILKAL